LKHYYAAYFLVLAVLARGFLALDFLRLVFLVVAFLGSAFLGAAFFSWATSVLNFFFNRASFSFSFLISSFCALVANLSAV
jgi:hypothetical protein